MARWSPGSSVGFRLLQDRLKPVLSPRCTHVKGRAGVKGTVRKALRNQPRCGCKLGCFCCEIDFSVALEIFRPSS